MSFGRKLARGIGLTIKGVGIAIAATAILAVGLAIATAAGAFLTGCLLGLGLAAPVAIPVAIVATAALSAAVLVKLHSEGSSPGSGSNWTPSAPRPVGMPYNAGTGGNNHNFPKQGSLANEWAEQQKDVDNKQNYERHRQEALQKGQPSFPQYDSNRNYANYTPPSF